MTLFVLAIAIALSNLAFVLFILPESLLPSRRLSHVPSPVVPSPVGQYYQHRRKGVIRRIVKTTRRVALQFLRPAALFIPLKLVGRKGRDWNLTLTGAALFIYMFADVSSINVYNAWADLLRLASV